jgi:sensor domain CHASE-containing protein
VLGAAIMVLLLVVVMPVAMLIGGGVVAAIMSASLDADARARHEGSELVELNN